jgi:hypothetical protein
MEVLGTDRKTSSMICRCVSLWRLSQIWLSYEYQKKLFILIDIQIYMQFVILIFFYKTARQSTHYKPRWLIIQSRSSTVEHIHSLSHSLTVTFFHSTIHTHSEIDSSWPCPLGFDTSDVKCSSPATRLFVSHEWLCMKRATLTMMSVIRHIQYSTSVYGRF